MKVQREKERAGVPGLVWMSPQSTKIETRRKIVRCKPRATGCYEESQWKFVETGVVLCSVGEGDRADKAVRSRWGGLGVREASCEIEQDEKKVDGVGHAEGDEVDELKV